MLEVKSQHPGAKSLPSLKAKVRCGEINKYATSQVENFEINSLPQNPKSNFRKNKQTSHPLRIKNNRRPRRICGQLRAWRKPTVTRTLQPLLRPATRNRAGATGQSPIRRGIFSANFQKRNFSRKATFFEAKIKLSLLGKR